MTGLPRFDAAPPGVPNSASAKKLKTWEPNQIWDKYVLASMFRCCPPWCPELGFGKKAQNAEAQPAQPEQHCLPGWASHNSGHFDFQKNLKKISNRKPIANKGNKADF